MVTVGRGLAGNRGVIKGMESSMHSKIHGVLVNNQKLKLNDRRLMKS